MIHPIKTSPPTAKIGRSHWAWAVFGTMVLATATLAQTRPYQGPCALAASKDGKTLFVANADAVSGL